MEPDTKTGPASLRRLKSKLFEQLKSTDFNSALEQTGHLSPLQTINLLFPFILSTNSQVKWNAVLSMGVVTRTVADEDRESARNIVRRLMWNLNDESGGIGWGSAEAMGEILRDNEFLMDEFLPILVSYLREDGNYQENEIIQRGVLWGIGRVGGRYPEKVGQYRQIIFPRLHSVDQGVRGLSAWIMGLLNSNESRSELKKLLYDQSEFETCMGDRVVTLKVGELAREALEKISFVCA